VEPPTYSESVQGGPLRQGEILSSLTQHILVSGAGNEMNEVLVRTKIHPFVVILSQDCDLAQDFTNRQNSTLDSRQSLPNVLLCEMDLADAIKTKGDQVARGSDIWKRVIQNKDERFQFLRAVPCEADAQRKGVEALIADFKHTFSIPTESVYKQVTGSAHRRALLLSPYREHLSSRLAYFISRVALVREHHT